MGDVLVMEGWDSEQVEKLDSTLTAMWPNAEQEARAALAEGIVTISMSTRRLPSEVFSALMALVEGGRSSLPNVGTVMAQINERRALAQGQTPQQGRKALPASGASKPWTPVLALATFINQRPGCERERFLALPAPVQEAVKPYAAMVRELGLRFEHNILGDPSYDADLYRAADSRARDLWDEHKGVSAHVAMALMAPKQV